jgi:flagellar biosynthesis component FlhA
VEETGVPGEFNILLTTNNLASTRKLLTNGDCTYGRYLKNFYDFSSLSKIPVKQFHLNRQFLIQLG